MGPGMTLPQGGPLVAPHLSCSKARGMRLLWRPSLTCMRQHLRPIQAHSKTSLPRLPRWPLSRFLPRFPLPPSCPPGQALCLPPSKCWCLWEQHPVLPFLIPGGSSLNHSTSTHSTSPSFFLNPARYSQGFPDLNSQCSHSLTLSEAPFSQPVLVPRLAL